MNLQLDHFSDDLHLYKKTPRVVVSQPLLTKNPNNQLFLPLELNHFGLTSSRPQQRVAMDDLASYFVEERSKVR